MDLDYPADVEPFRAEIRAWLVENLPDDWGTPGFSMTPAEKKAFNQEWTKKLFEGGWICASWPKEYGGKGLSLMESVVLNEEFARAEAPLRADFFGDTLVGPTILQWGSEEQKQQFIPRILNGTIAWCQGFSEPDAGSDLASLKTRAELDGDEWVINGQKVWTTQARFADYIFLLARTDPDAPKHAGISYLLVPMQQPGVEVRPIEQIDGSAEFNEVFFTNVRCPKENVVGGVNNGWKVAMTTLGFERGSSATTGHRRFRRELDQIIDVAKKNGHIADPLIRQRLATAWTKVKIMEINGYRSLTDSLNGTHHMAALSACNKMFWSEFHRDTLDLAMDILGPDAQILTGSPGEEDERVRRGRDAYPVSDLQASFFFSRSETIWGGTAEIQRNIVGERVLGLPKEPKPAAAGA
ncbi:MAG TPA: acyl-CoA dehydrogenase family protein [Acidimicrobiales bacterium]|nr:acyl-CoA dehydrogenase family protein [Acidimicrobiales bacterium]